MIIEIAFSVFNHRRYTNPWGARITFDGIKPAYNFEVARWTGGYRGEAGDLVFDVAPGDVIAYGQKDLRKGYGSKDIAIVQDDGSLVTVTESVARKHFHARQASPPTDDKLPDIGCAL